MIISAMRDPHTINSRAVLCPRAVRGICPLPLAPVQPVNTFLSTNYRLDNVTPYSNISPSCRVTVLLILIGCSSPFMRLAEQLTALRAWCF